jgi:hypothetical protein
MGEGDRLPLQNEDLYVLADYWEVRNVKNFTQDEGRMGGKIKPLTHMLSFGTGI